MARGRGGGRKTDYSWSSVCGEILNLDLAETTKAVGNGTVVVTTPLTFMRLRGRIMATLDATAVNERAVIAVGIILADDQAVAAGVVSLPGPDSQGEDFWIWHGYLMVDSGSEASVNQNFLSDRLEIDSKAMRKARSNDTLVLIAEVCSSTDQGGVVDLQYGLRALVGEGFPRAV